MKFLIGFKKYRTDQGNKILDNTPKAYKRIKNKNCRKYQQILVLSIFLHIAVQLCMRFYKTVSYSRKENKNRSSTGL